MKMEGSGGSGVLKKKSSSGCLIIKKTGLNKNSGGGLGGLSGSSKEKKRARLVASSSSSSSSSSDDDESLEFMRRKVTEKRLKNGSMGYNREHGRDSVGIEDSAERKRSRLDLFEFDEYDEFDGKKMRDELFGDRFKATGRNDSGIMKESGVSSSRNFVVDKRKQGSHLGGSSRGKSKGTGQSGARNKGFDLEDDEAHMPISLLRLKYQETAGESIRLQGKNGVLKVMVNKKKVDFSSQPKNCDPRELKERKVSKPDDVVKKDILKPDDVVKKDLSVPSLVNLGSKTPKNQGSIVYKEKSADKGKRKSKSEMEQPFSNKGSKSRDLEVDGTNTELKLPTPRPQASSSKKGVKKEAERSPDPETSTPVKGKEGKEGNAKRSGSTEKQMLREKIRGLLLDAGWKIDYRPRRNRDYLDSVYINPSGTAYWSIIKAYDAFKKQLDEDNGKVNESVDSPSFAHLSEDLINKLTRKTKKKIAEEMRRKRKQDAMTKSTKRSAIAEAAESSDSDQSVERRSTYIKQDQKSQGKFRKVDKDSDDDIGDKQKLRRVKPDKTSTASKSNVIQGRTSKVIGRCTLLVRSSDRAENSDFDGYVPYTGKRTVLAWLIDSGTAKLSEKVQYMNRRRTRVMLEGWITRDGIHCGCCSKILTVSKFELHAGSKLRQPFQNIFLESGSSLLQCQIDAWNSQEESMRRDFFTVDVDGDDPDDDTCGICGDGGDLICCDSCPSTFHQICLEIKTLPKGDWHCPNCTCKFCGNVSGDVAEENNSTGYELETCNFCEKKYHKSCSERAGALPMSSNSASFCGMKCQEIYDHLQKILGIKNELEAGISWSLIRRADVSDASQRGFPLRVECNSKLAVALSVMDECFLPIIDRRSGINMIQNVVYNCGSNFNRLNFRGFYMAIVERGDEIISAASIRLHGDRLAEMPFIGVREIYRRQGMCRRLLSAIETELRSLKVGQLIIPAIAEHMNTWTTVFGFHELEDVHKKEIKSMNMLVFPGTDMLQKQIAESENSDGKKISESTNDQPQLPVPVEKPEVDLSLEQNSQSSSDSGGCREAKTIDEVNAPASASPVPAFPSNACRESENTATSVSDAVCESDIHLAGEGATAFKPDVENKQNESADNTKCSPTPAENHNSSDNERRVLEHPANDNLNSSEESVVGDACKTEAPCPKSTPDFSGKTRNSDEATCIQSGSALESSKFATDSPKPVNNGCVDSVFEVSAKDSNGTTDSNQDSAPISTLPDDEENSDFKAKSGLLVKGVVQEAVDHSETDKPDGKIEAPRLVDGNGISPVSSSEAVNSAAISTLPDNQESIMASNADVAVQGVVKEAVDHAETDKPDRETETPHPVDGNDIDPACKALAQDTTTTTTENHVQ